MALFISQDGTHYFNYFYSSEKQKFSGNFYILSARAAKTLATLYALTACLATYALAIELFTPVLFRGFDADQRNLFFAVFFMLNAAGILPAALLVAMKRKRYISSAHLQIQKARSIPVYISTILLPTNYSIMMGWKAYLGEASALFPVAAIMTMLAIAGSTYRIFQIHGKANS